MNSTRKQPILGAIAGLVLGFFVGLLVSPDKSDPYQTFQRVWETILNCSAGGTVVGFILGCFANRLLKGRTKHVAVGLLAGVILGLLGGVLVSEFMFERAVDLAGFDRDDPFFGKRTAAIRVSYRTFSLIFGPILGGAAGAGVGILFWSELKQPVTVRFPR